MLVRSTKSDGNQPAFMPHTVTAMQDDNEAKKTIQLMFTTQLRNPNGDNTSLTHISNSGKEYTHDLFVVLLGKEKPIQAIDTFVKVLDELTDSVKSSYHYGAPKFNKGGVFHLDKPVRYFLTDDDCVTLIKRLYDGCETLEDFMENEALEGILTEVFGSYEDGMEVVDKIDGYEWDTKY